MHTEVKNDPFSLYAKILMRDEQYDDVFFFAVTSTGIYCRPTCPARRPLQKNCRFFETAQEAESNGFRACKRCRPDRPKHDIVDKVVSRLHHTIEKPHDNSQFSERQLRRLVKYRTGKTPSQLVRMQQLARARYLLKHTDLPVVNIAFQLEFTSLRQFSHAFKKAYGISPRQMRQQLEEK